ncbi:ribosome maturation factor RimP [Fervidibacillus halotolerans]|uniref:Ribosome maturation factor RimP n=1 Tax=Fervidibacillus halotolerans TaxID=2980027 RepID=A0A9E8M140_9BACI|nr:ribosome maturation factor RimP [Fervidibacillus halotolerans]WAA13568.1 ribosome maturation factor RimP [Fervidibacillus halotolerans]
MSKIAQTVHDLALPIVRELNMEIVDIEYVKEGKNYFLRVFIDKETGIDIEDCEMVSERLSEKLDEVDPIPHNYYLEVSSPGAERPLKRKEDFEKSVGKRVYIKTYEPIEKEKIFEGTLTNFDGENVYVEILIKTRKKQVMIPLKKIALARLAVSF